LHPFDHCAEVSPSIALPIEIADPSRPLGADDARRVAEAIASEIPAVRRLMRQRIRLARFLARNAAALVVGLVVLSLIAALWWWPTLRNPRLTGVVVGLAIVNDQRERA
jgi:hypothetical protein